MPPARIVEPLDVVEEIGPGRHRPGDAGELVGERYCQHIVVQPLLCRLDPALQTVPFPTHRLDENDPRRLHEQLPQIAVSALRYFAQDRAIARRHLLGHEPKPAAKSRPFVNTSPEPMAATTALEMIGPTRGS